MFWPALITSHCYKLVMVLPNINGLCWNFPWLFSALGWMFWQQSFNHFVGQRNRGCSTSFKVTIWYLHYLEEDLWMWQREDSVYWRCLLHYLLKKDSRCYFGTYLHQLISAGSLGALLNPRFLGLQSCDFPYSMPSAAFCSPDLISPCFLCCHPFYYLSSTFLTYLMLLQG